MGKKMNSEPLGKFYNGGRTRVRREWRGLADTWFDYKCWVKTWGLLCKFLMKPQNLKGFLSYRWMLNYIATPDFIDRCNEGLRGKQLRLSHMEFGFIVKELMNSLTLMFKADQNIGGSKERSDKMVIMDEKEKGQSFGLPRIGRNRLKRLFSVHTAQKSPVIHKVLPEICCFIRS